MTDNEIATRLIYEIESTLATLSKLTVQELDHLAEADATGFDLYTLSVVNGNLLCAETAWAKLLDSRGDTTMTNVTLSTTHSATPDTADVRDLDVTALYAALDHWISERSVHGRGNTPEADGFRAVANPEIRRLKRELTRRGLPTDSWEYDAQLAEEAVADELDTQRCALGERQ